MVSILEQSSPFQRVGQAFGQGLSSGLELLVSKKLEAMQEQRQRAEVIDQYEDLLSRGFSPNEAALWLRFTEGGKTHLAKEIVERMQRERGLTSRGIGPPEEDERVGLPEDEEAIIPREEEKIEIGRLTPREEIPREEEKIEITGLTPKEKVSREETRYKTNLPLFQALQKKVRGHESEGLSIQYLQELNKSGKLPKGLQRWNVNFESGELRFAFLANAATQAFIKTINDFTTKAKDSFGARVTNFELNRFMKRLPGLLNTGEGRRIILRQMEIINQINSFYDQATLDVFDRSGGIRKIDWDKAQQMGKRDVKPMIDKLKKEFTKLRIRGGKLLGKRPREKSMLKKVPAGTEITEEVVDRLLDQTDGDVEKSREIAKKLGYDF